MTQEHAIKKKRKILDVNMMSVDINNATNSKYFDIGTWRLCYMQKLILFCLHLRLILNLRLNLEITIISNPVSEIA